MKETAPRSTAELTDQDAIRNLANILAPTGYGQWLPYAAPVSGRDTAPTDTTAAEEMWANWQAADGTQTRLPVRSELP